MARPLKFTMEGVEEARIGEAHKVKGHERFALHVRAYDGFDPSEDTLYARVEAAPDENGAFARIDRGSPYFEDVLSRQSEDIQTVPDQDGVYASYIASNSYPVEAIRPRVVDHSGGFQVDLTVFTTGWAESSSEYREPGSP